MDETTTESLVVSKGADMNQPSKIQTVPARPALRIFVVEDSLAVRDVILESMAQIPGIVVTGYAETEADALSRLNTEMHDILILDIELKTGNGMSLLRQLAQNGNADSTLKIIFSNNVSDVFRRTGQQYGVTHFFDKTSEFSLLYALLEKLGENRRC